MANRDAHVRAEQRAYDNANVDRLRAMWLAEAKERDAAGEMFVDDRAHAYAAATESIDDYVGGFGKEFRDEDEDRLMYAEGEALLTSACFLANDLADMTGGHALDLAHRSIYSE